ncbi:MaoC/PaaZ C-terminal domain-containing protein [Ningiella sp. W23]|uniref:MaoC/PaaZ C-terminal domain-containing protein n=1 Tax=Ningiella sp. W23 TaxID=3023715 RepID=UPI0037583F46
MTMLSMLAKAAIYQPPRTHSVSGLGDRMLVQKHHINPEQVAQYNEIVEWPQEQSHLLHPNYIQVMSLPMQLDLMTSSPFPFKALGLVHIANRINIVKLPELESQLTISCYFGHLYSHKRGAVFEVHTDASLNGVVAVKATSYYLAKANKKTNFTYGDGLSTFSPSVFSDPSHKAVKAQAQEDSQHTQYAHDLSFSAQCGRRYAAVSGDYNPIHLWPATSRLFGFKNTIAHGMYSHARCISALQANASVQCQKMSTIKVLFKQAIELPAKTTLHSSSDNHGNTHFTLRKVYPIESHAQSVTRGKLHLQGSISRL